MHNGVLSVDEINELRKYPMLKANGQMLYSEIFANNHRPDIRSFYRNNPDYKWSKYFINNYKGKLNEKREQQKQGQEQEQEQKYKENYFAQAQGFK